ncbi:MAG: hypothetical protein JEZ04_02790 [Spirochaetales bacterium]|nr:hypothetical protein [Spirochaetales bacterium]
MNRFTLCFILLLIFSLPVYSAGEGVLETEQAVPGRLPVTRVTLFTAGLAQMVHETKVNDDEVLTFQADPKDINDLLKSLNIEDLDGGTVDVVNFDSIDPLSVTLGDFRLNPSGSPSVTDFLFRTQGESVTVKSGGQTQSGRIFNVEQAQSEEGPRTILNLMNSGGISAIDISDLGSLQFDDPVLQKELNSALKLIADSRLKTVRNLRISFRGSGERRIRLSYIKAVPLWKTSYRIVLDEDGVPRLEGWAIVQNTGGSSWEDIRLSFVAGKPNAFTMDLSTPRYITRRSVDIAAETPMGPTSYAKGLEQPPPQASMSRAYSEAPSMAMEAEAYDYAYAEEPYSPPALTSQAPGVREGNFYRYEINHPVTINARSSAMIPIVSEGEAGTSLGIYDPSYGLVFKGIRLTNNTEAHWAAGPVTVTEGRFYGGDALLPEMIPGSNRLLTYAQHGTLEVDKLSTSQGQKITALKITDGILYRTDMLTRETLYHVEGDENELLIIYPKESGWKLTMNPEIAEETQSEYRFTVSTWDKPIKVSEEYIISRQFSLNNFRQSDIAVYVEWSGITPAMKKALNSIAELKTKVENIRLEINNLNNHLSRIERDQLRMRENMKVLDKESDLFKQYSGTFASQEKELGQLNSDISMKQNEILGAEKTLKDYISSLNL